VVDCIVALPAQLFYTTGIPVCLWFLDRDKASSGERDRRGETLFIDARHMGKKINRTQIELTDEELAQITDAYRDWRGTTGGEYTDLSGFSYSASLAEIDHAGYTLSPGRFVGAPESEEDEVLFEERMAELLDRLSTEMADNQRLDAMIREALEQVGFAI
jgi:type I restriction enzyme M protein